MHYLLLV
ncbi:uncharacterized protein FFC1_06519 [Fusarium fujikuroi]|nr:uncharacterized protein FFC1_06519 [Fusarium fujikuroi]